MSSNPSLESEVQKELEQLLDEFIAGLNRLRQRITATSSISSNITSCTSLQNIA